MLKSNIQTGSNCRLEVGEHILEVALRLPEDDDPGHPNFDPTGGQVRDRIVLVSRSTEPPRVPPRPKSAGSFSVLTRTRRTTSDAGEEQQETWEAHETAVLVLDMWAQHGCFPASLRARDIGRKLNPFLIQARDKGAVVIFIPSSGVEEMAPSYPIQRRRMEEAQGNCSEATRCVAHGRTHAGQAVPPKPSEPSLPFDQGCDDGRGKMERWDDDSHRQMEILDIFPADGLSDNAEEVFGFLLAEGIKNVVLTGVHANECILKRPFGLRLLADQGFNAVLARDLTDVLYDPADPPHVSHHQGLQLLVHHIEAYVAPTVLADHLVSP